MPEDHTLPDFLFQTQQQTNTKTCALRCMTNANKMRSKTVAKQKNILKLKKSS